MMNRVTAGGLTANRPIIAPPQPAPSYGLSPNIPMNMNNFAPSQQAGPTGLSANNPMVMAPLAQPQMAMHGLSANRPMTANVPLPPMPQYQAKQQAASAGLSSNRPISMMQNPISEGLSANRPMSMMQNIASSGLSANRPAMQPAAPSLSANRPIEMSISNVITPSIAANRPMRGGPPVPGRMAPIAAGRGSGLGHKNPISVAKLSPDNTIQPTLSSSPMRQSKEASISVDRPIAQPTQPYNYFNNDVMDLEIPDLMYPEPVKDQPWLPTFVPLREQPSENFFIEREGQLVYMQQGIYASKTGPEPEPVHKKVAEAEYCYTSELAGKYSSNQSILPTNQIDHEIQALKELYDAQFITHAQYEQRVSELEAALKHSFVSIVPHIEAMFSESRRSTTGSTKNRNVRLFISSTFSDMQHDREVIMKKVVPKLQAACKERGVVLSVVDLRWGITSEQSNQGQTINICLKEIDRCRPYFLCLLGNRYGWSQPVAGSGKPKDQLLQRTFENSYSNFSWTEKYADRSITELEVRHAVLSNPSSETARRALFFLRGNHHDDDDKRLTALKDEILMNSDIKTKSYQEASHLDALITPILEAIINDDFPMEKIPSLIERERMSHEAFQETRASVYIGRQYYFDTINSHLANPIASPLVIIGGSGSGKSALVCNWVVRYKESHPTQLILAHYVGSTSASTDLGRLLARVLNELKEFFKIEKEVPSELKDLIDQFPQWLALAARSGGFVLVLDALNQLDPQGNSHDLSWLPLTLPQNVKLVVSTLPGKVKEAVLRRKWASLEVQPLTQSERKTLVIEYLSMSGKTLTETQLNLIISSKQCENPLFLRVLLEEIQTFGVFEELEKHIKSYLVARDPPELFALVFSRLEKEYDTQRPGLVGDMLSLLWVSRRGLTEDELIAILKISSALWSPLYLAFSESIVAKSGYLAFFHDYMRQAVEKRYLQPRNSYYQYQRMLIDYFSSLPNTDQRKFEEAPYQMDLSGSTSDLYNFIVKLDHFTQLIKSEHKFDLYRYWRSVCQSVGNPAQVLISSTQGLTGAAALQGWSDVGTFLEEVGDYEPAQKCSEEAMRLAQLAGDKDMVCKKQTTLAYILRLRGKYSEAAPHYEKALAYLENKPDVNQRELAQNINSLAILYRMMGKFDKAEPLYKRALSIRQSLFGSKHEDIAQSMNSLGCLNQDMGRYADSEKFLLEAVSQREQLLGSGHPDVAMSLNNLGGLYLDWSKYALAEPAYTRALKIYEAVFGSNHPLVAKSYNSLAGLMNEQGKYKEAEKLYEKSLSLKEQLLGPNHPELALTLNDFAVLYSRQDNFAKAQQLYERAMKIRETVLGTAHPDYAQSVKNLAACYQDQQRYDEALPLFQRALDISTIAFGQRHPDVASGHSSLAGCLQMLSRFDESEKNYEKAISLLIELNGIDHGDVALACNDMAVLQWRKGNMARSEEYYMKALNSYQNVYGAIHPHVGTAVQNIANFFKGIGNFEKALKYFKQCYDIFSATAGPDAPKTLLVQQEIAVLS